MLYVNESNIVSVVYICIYLQAILIDIYSRSTVIFIYNTLSYQPSSKGEASASESQDAADERQWVAWSWWLHRFTHFCGQVGSSLDGSNVVSFAHNLVLPVYITCNHQGFSCYHPYTVCSDD